MSDKRDYIKERIRDLLGDAGTIIGAAENPMLERIARRMYGRLKDLEVDIDILEEELTQDVPA